MNQALRMLGAFLTIDRWCGWMTHPNTEHRVRRKRKKRVRKVESSNRKKMALVFAAILLCICALILRLTQITLENKDEYARVVLAQLDYDSQTIPFKRGDITDRNGTVLATSEKVYNLILDPYVVLNSRGDCEKPTAKVIEKYFDIDSSEIYKILDDNPEGRYVVLAKELDYDTVKAYQDYMNPEDGYDSEDDRNFVKGIWFEEEYLRTYPYESLACKVLGYTNKGNEGTWGIEGYYNDMLNGTNGREYGYLSEDTDFSRTTVAAENGYQVVSTIDLNIQRIVEKYIQQFLAERECENIGVIVADPNTGEILAMADGMSFDLNEPRNISAYFTDEEKEAMSDEETVNFLNKLWRNFCISDTYEAGSTIKPLTIGSALDEHRVSTTDTFTCDGGQELFDGTETQYIACHNVYGHGTTTLEEAIMWSCNDALMQIGDKIGKEDMLNYQQLFGFGSKTGIDLPGEASAEGLVYDADSMGSFELATSTFGQGYNLTMIQMVAAFSSIVNGGHYYQPHIVKEIQTENGNVVKSFDKVLVRNIFSEETCNWLKNAMYKTVYDDGVNTTGTAARVAGYTVGGKTGTAEKGQRGLGKYVVSFIGFAPVENPEIVVYVVIDELKDSQEDSGTPTKMAGDIMSEVLPYLQVFPSDGTEVTTNDYKWGAESETKAEDETDTQGETQTTENTGDLEAFLSQWTDEDSDGYDDYTGEYYWDDLAEFMEANGLSDS